MIRLMRYLLPVLMLVLVLPVHTSPPALAQERTEPDFVEVEAPLSHRDFDIRNGAGLRLQLNDFGFALGGEYRRVAGRYTKVMLEVQINSVRDQSEQTFQNLWGYQVVPNKHNRVLAMPAMVGVSRRLLAEQLSDNFRLNVQLSGGPTLAYVYPYYDHDLFNVGFRPTDQQHHDPFQGWGDGTFTFGTSGQISIGANLGGDFTSIQSVRIGYFFHYFPDGIQIMEPKRPGPNLEDYQPGLPPEEQAPGVLEPAADRQNFFGSPHITLVFGSMW